MASWNDLFRGHETAPSIIIPNAPDGTRIVVVSDAQVPLEDPRLLDTIFSKLVPDFKPRTKGAEYHLFLAGDMLDNFTLSSFLARVQPRFDVGDEVQMVKEYLPVWGKRFSHKHYAFGNHEDRWDRYVWEQAPKMARVLPTLGETLGLENLGYDHVPYLKHYDFCGFIVTHGDTTVKAAATKMLETYHTSGCSGHTNRPQSYTWTAAAKLDPITWYTLGMTCRRDIGDVIKNWRKTMPWQQAFGIGEVRGGVLHFQLVRVHHGSFFANGKVYSVD